MTGVGFAANPARYPARQLLPLQRGAPGTLGFSHSVSASSSLNLFIGTMLGEDGGRRANDLSQLLSPHCENSSAPRHYFILLNCRGSLLKLFLQTFNYCIFFTTIGFICPRNCLQQFKMSEFGAGVRSANTNPKLVQKQLLFKKKKPGWKALMLCLMLCT